MNKARILRGITISPPLEHLSSNEIGLAENTEETKMYILNVHDWKHDYITKSET